MRNKIRRLAADRRLQDAVLLAIAGLYCVGVVRAAEVVWPGRTPAILLSLPIVVASYFKSPEFVMGVAVLAIVVDALNVAAEHPPLSLLVVTLLALVGMGFVGVSISFERQKEIERRRRHEAMVQAVESLRQPLTVIVGYTHLLRSQADLPEAIQRPLAKIGQAASDLTREIGTLLGQTTTPSDTDSR